MATSETTADLLATCDFNIHPQQTPLSERQGTLPVIAVRGWLAFASV